MSNRGFRIVWFNLHTENGKKFRLSFPISLNVFRELMDSFQDLITVICLFVPKSFASKNSISIHAVKEIAVMVIELLGSITDDGPYDLVDVEADNVKVSIKIR
ncbi:MAG: hypothetical protein CVU91_09135 [Firmicutes bacterium HGW-Firmicutes-16]|nr:MAG: hypothetical protein CVU91_09135 [Firmicutes bacterium HGW-Firmicutes-16]